MKGLSCLVIGGHAVNVHGFARFTKDLDLLVCRTDSEKWMAVLKSVGYVVEHDGGNFIQLKATEEASAPPIDLMLVSESTFLEMKADGRPTQIQNASFLIPSLDHLLALKLHALKHGPPHRGYKDFVDVLSLIEVNHIDVRGEKFRALCDKFGDARIYERLVSFRQE